MRVSHTVLFSILGLAIVAVLAGRPPIALADSAAADDLAWVDAVRSRVFHAVTTSRSARSGVATISFTVSETGEITEEHFDGPPDIGSRAMTALRKLGHLPPPPDHRLHHVNFRLRVH